MHLTAYAGSQFARIGKLLREAFAQKFVKLLLGLPFTGASRTYFQVGLQLTHALYVELVAPIKRSQIIGFRAVHKRLSLPASPLAPAYRRTFGLELPLISSAEWLLPG